MALSATPVFASAASTILVPTDHPTISQAIGFAQDGDTILVSPGVYPEQVDFSGKDIVIRSADGPQTTIIDGQALFTPVMFVSGEGPNARLEGFTVRNGLGVQSPEAGGIWCENADPTIVNCIVTGNQGSDASPSCSSCAGAGGIGSCRASPTIEGCVIESNTGGRAGNSWSGAGGIGLERAGTFGNGGGFVIRDCQIRLNRGGDIINDGTAGPGGIFTFVTKGIIEDCTISQNVGGDLPPSSTGGRCGAGGLEIRNSAVQVGRCRVLSNLGGNDQNADGSQHGGEGGIRYNGHGPNPPSMPNSLVNCVVAWNRGGVGDFDGGAGGVLLYSQAWVDITNCAIVGNIGGQGGAVGGIDYSGLWSALLPTITNTVFWLNDGQGRPDDLGSGPTPEPIVSNLLMGADPLFVDVASNDFHIRCDSPAIDTGTELAPVLPLTDFDGEPRQSGAQVDIGPDEFVFETFPTYCEANVNSSGLVARICAGGDPSIAANDLTIQLEGLPGTSGLLFYGPNQIQVSFGDGFRCVGGAVRRLPPMSGMGSSIAIDLNLPNLQITAGVQANFQYWFRDLAAGGAGYNLSNGLEVNFVP